MTTQSREEEEEEEKITAVKVERLLQEDQEAEVAADDLITQC